MRRGARIASLFGLGIAGLVLALAFGLGAAQPARAQSFTSCPVGEVFVSSDGHGNSCCSGSLIDDGVGGSICAGAPNARSTNLPAKVLRGWLLGLNGAGGQGGDPAFSDDDDPWARVSRRRVSPVNTSIGGQVSASTTNEVGAGADMHANFGRLFDLRGDDQRLQFGGFFDYMNQRTNYDVTTLAFGSSINRNVYRLGPTVGYKNGETYVFAFVGYLWSNGSIRNGEDFSTASVHSNGYTGHVEVGHVFTLLDARTYASPKIVKGPLPPAVENGGYRIGLDLSGRFNSAYERMGGFIDTAAFARNAEIYSAVSLGVKARLFADVFRDGLIWTPYLSGTFDQIVAFDHHVSFPLQVTVPVPQTVSYGAQGRSYLGVNGGLSVRQPNGIQVGAEGFFQGSNGTRGYGGKVYLRMPILRWLGVSG